MSKYDGVVFSCIVGYKLRLRVSGYSQLAIYLATPNVNTYKQGGLDVPPYMTAVTPSIRFAPRPPQDPNAMDVDVTCRQGPNPIVCY